MTQLFANNARSRLVGALSNSATTFTVESATADTFRVANTTDWLTPLDWFKATLENSLGQVEIIKVGVRGLGSGIFSNVLRGQDGTTAIAFDAGATVGLRITAADVENALALREVDGDFSGENNFSGVIKQNGVQARMVPVHGVIMWWGEVADIEEGWQLCDGTNGTPDLRDRFVIGARQDDAGVAKTNITGSLTSSGGSKDAVLPSHTHTATVGNQSADHTHSGTTNTTGSHNHTLAIDGSGVNYNGPGPNPVAQRSGSGYPTTFAGDHSHTITTGGQSGSHNHAVTNSTEGVSPTNANLPPYYALAFIACMAYA